MRRQCDNTREDDELLTEVELATKLIIAASEFDDPMPLETIDRILEVPSGPASSV